MRNLKVLHIPTGSWLKEMGSYGSWSDLSLNYGHLYVTHSCDRVYSDIYLFLCSYMKNSPQEIRDQHRIDFMVVDCETEQEVPGVFSYQTLTEGIS